MNATTWAVTYRGFAGLRGFLLYILSIPLLFKTIGSLWSGDVTTFAASAAGFGLLVAGARVLRRGIRQETALDVTRPLSYGRLWPFKAMGCSIVGLATGFVAFATAGQDPVTAAAFGIAATGGCLLSYGLDPKVQSVTPAGDAGEAEEAAEVLREAYGRLDRITAAGQVLTASEFRERLARITALAQDILKLVEADPADLRRTRKFIKVYLDGAERVTEQYARTHQYAHSPDLERNFRELLTHLEAVCREQHEKLIRHEVTDLDVEIEVLTARLRQEGVR